MCKSKWWIPADGGHPSQIKFLKSKDIKFLRELLSTGFCDICNSPLKDFDPRQIHLEHSHLKTLGTGFVRGVCCARCNRRLGKIENDWKKMSPVELEQWLYNAYKYIQRNNNNPTNILHPKERSEYGKINKNKS